MYSNTMKWALSAAVVMAVGTLLAAVSVAQEAQTKPDAPADRPELTINGEHVMKGELDNALAEMNLPKYKQPAQRAELLNRAAHMLLTDAYVEKKKLPVDEETFRKSVKRLRTRMAMAKLVRDSTTEEKVRAFMEENPHLFDGTRIKVSQIMINSPVYDSTTKQMAARRKLQDIAKQIAAGHITFAEAAEQHSDDPSRIGGGDMGWFDIGSAGDLNFAYHCFNTLKGSVSPIVRTGGGWHIVLVTEKTLGDGQPKPWVDARTQRKLPPEMLAARLIATRIDQEILLSPVTGAAVDYHKVGD